MPIGKALVARNGMVVVQEDQEVDHMVAVEAHADHHVGWTMSEELTIVPFLPAALAAVAKCSISVVRRPLYLKLS